MNAFPETHVEAVAALESGLTPAEIVSELDKYIISQEEAKRAVAIALRNRWRRLKVTGEMRDEIIPKNIIMMGPTGVGKTEIARRLARLVRAPFIKIEATKFTEVGYVGRDVDSIVRDLVDIAYNMVREEERESVLIKAEKIAGEKLLDLLLPDSRPVDSELSEESETSGKLDLSKTRERFRRLLQDGKLEDRLVEVELTRQVSTHMQVLGPQGFGEIEGQLKDMFASMVPKQRETKRLSVAEARKVLIQEAQDSLIDYDKVARVAVERAEETGIVFLDEIDKICGRDSSGKGPDVSREGVQRDLLPLVEGTTVSTRYGNVRTDHVLFIASGAFHVSKPSDLMPEFQGRFPIRVELKSLSPEHFVRILTEPRNALVRQYQALLETEGVKLEFSDEAVSEIAQLTAEVNASTENIGARRLYTLMEKLLEDLLFSADREGGRTLRIDRQDVQRKLSGIVEDRDQSRFIL